MTNKKKTTKQQGPELPAPTEPKLYVYTGKRLSHGGLVQCLAPVENDGTVINNPEFWYRFDKIGKLYLGGVYSFKTVENPDGGHVLSFPSNPYPERTWSDRAAMMAWKIENDAAEAQYSVMGESKTVAREAMLGMLLELRARYHDIITPSQRIAFQLTVLDAIAVPPSSQERIRLKGRRK